MCRAETQLFLLAAEFIRVIPRSPERILNPLLGNVTLTENAARPGARTRSNRVVFFNSCAQIYQDVLIT